MSRRSMALATVALGACLAWPAYGATPIAIGVESPITGPYANEGQGVVDATRLAVREVNAHGGLLGHPLKVIVCDDQGKAAAGAICARQLSSDHVLAEIGTYTSGSALAGEPIYERAHVIQISNGSSSELTSHGYKTFFRATPPASADAQFAAHYMKVQGYKRIAVLTDHSSFSTNLAGAMVAAARHDGLDVIDEAYITAGSQNYTPVLTKLKAMHLDALYFAGYYTDGGLIKAQMAQLGMKTRFFGGEGNANAKFAQLAGSAAPGAIIIDLPPPEQLGSPAAKAFLAHFKQVYGHEPPSIYTVATVDGLDAVLQTARRIHSVAPDKLIPALHDLKNFKGMTGTFSWNGVGERVGGGFVALELGPNGASKIVYPPQGS